MAIYPLEAVDALQNLWISPVAVIPQLGRHLRLIFDFTWSGLYEAKKRLSPMEVMCFGGVLQRILRQVLPADPSLGPVYLNNVELVHAYMRLWVRMGDVPSFAFLIPKKTPSDLHLVRFHLSMGYVDSAPYFCIAIETLADLSNKVIDQQGVASSHPLEQEAEARVADDAGAP